MRQSDPETTSTAVSHAVEASGPPQSSLLSGIPEHDRELILGMADERRIAAKEVIFRGGDRASDLFLLREGNAKYYRLTEQGEELLLRWLVPGDIFGLSTFLKDPPGYIGTAEAATKCTLWTWGHASIRNLSSVYPQMSQNALRITLGYLAAYVDRHAGIATQNATQRVGHTLLRLAHRAGRPHPAGVDVDITNEQLGGLADVGLFTVSRLLGNWQREGIITKARGRIRIQDPEKLLEK